MRKTPRLAELGPRYEQETGRSSVVAADERRDEHQPTRLSLGAGWRLVRTPSSENGISEYYRVLLDRPPEPEALLGRMRALHLGSAMRFEVLAAVANSEEARRRGVGGPGIRLINLVALAVRRSGAARLVKRRRFNRALMQLLERDAAGLLGASAGGGVDPAELDLRLRKLLMEQGPAPMPVAEDNPELADRIAALEDVVLDLLNERARDLRSAQPPSLSSGLDGSLPLSAPPA